MDISVGKHIVKKGVEGDLFGRIEWINFAVVLGSGSRFEFDFMIPFASWWKLLGSGLFKDLAIIHIDRGDEFFQGTLRLFDVLSGCEFSGLSKTACDVTVSILGSGDGENGVRTGTPGFLDRERRFDFRMKGQNDSFKR